MLDDEIIAAIRERQSARAKLARSIGTPAPGVGGIPRSPATPRSLPMLHPAVAPAAVRRADDRFRCPKLACELSAAACAERQQLSNQRRRHTGRLNRYELADHAAATGMVTCRNCPDGRRIAARLGVSIVESSGNSYVDDELYRKVSERKSQRVGPAEKRP